MTEELQSVDGGSSGLRLIALLTCIAEAEGGCSLKHLSETVGIPPSSAHRSLQVLIRGGLVERAQGQSYRAGSGFLRIAQRVLRQASAADLVRPLLRRLWEDWQESCIFALYKPALRRIMVADVIPTPHPLRFVIEPFTEMSLAWGSLGRSVLAELSPGEMRTALTNPGVGPLSHQPLPSLEALRDELATIRQQGFALYRNEMVDVAGIATVVRRPDGSILGTIGVTMPARRLAPGMEAPLAAAVKATGEAATALFGGAPPA